MYVYINIKKPTQTKQNRHFVFLTGAVLFLDFGCSKGDSLENTKARIPGYSYTQLHIYTVI